MYTVVGGEVVSTMVGKTATERLGGTVTVRLTGVETIPALLTTVTVALPGAKAGPELPAGMVSVIDEFDQLVMGTV